MLLQRALVDRGYRFELPCPGQTGRSYPAAARLRDPARGGASALGVPWFAQALDEWRRVGPRRLIDLRELSAALALRPSLLRDPGGEWEVGLSAGGGGALPRPLRVLLRVPDGPPPAEIRVECSGTDLRLQVPTIEGDLGGVMLPPSASQPPA